MFTAFAIVAFVYAVGLGAYTVLDNGKEKPEPIETDVEHDSAGKPLPKTSPQYWAAVLVEGLFSYPSAKIRKLVGLPQK